MLMNKDNMLFGMMIGAVMGAFYVQSNKKAQQMVQKGKTALKRQLENM